MIAYGLMADRFELGTGKISPQGLLVELNQALDDAAAFGMDVDQTRQALWYQAELHHQKCYVKLIRL